MKKLTVIGANGMLGFAAKNYFPQKDWKVTALSRAEFDIASDSISKLVPYIEDADLIINCAGVIKPRIASMSVEDVVRVNSIFPHSLAKLANQLGKKAIHITTDCIYSGRTGKYNELCEVDAQDLYGLSKAAGDTPEIMTIRTSIIGEEPKGQKRSLVEWVKDQNGKSINGFTNHNWNGVTTWYLCTLIDKIFEKNLYQKGIFHLHSPNTLTKAELVSEIAKVYNIDVKINPVPGPEFCDRSMSTVHPLARELAILTIQEQLQKSKAFFDGIQDA